MHSELLCVIRVNVDVTGTITYEAPQCNIQNTNHNCVLGVIHETTLSP